MESLLLTGAVLAVLLWAALAAYVIHIDRRRTAARAVVSAVLTTLREEGVRSAPIGERVARVQPLLERVSRDMVLHTAADTATPRDAVDVLTTYLVDRWGVYTLVRQASSHRMSRDVWRRTASLKVLFHLGHPQIFDLLTRAVQGRESDIASVAFALLGTSHDPRATAILVEALKAQRHPASRVAVHLEHSPLRPVGAYRPLLKDPDPVVRFWGATLLAHCPDVAWLEGELAALADDGDARVRKAAVQSLGKVGDAIAAEVALRLLEDPAPFVRAHAARALGELDRTEAGPAVAQLLGDPDWWVRAAAKQSLEAMGSDVWPVLMRCLEHPDRFVRNGAAEVFQNLGILDSLIMMEAASDDPSYAKIKLLKRIAAAGGSRMTDSLIERAGSAAPRVRRLLATMGLEQVGAA
ncbi:MAG TPA: HEAT repeat domain-containing protein [Vicinamibacterales bacterium]|nr:HEAT repeat domain-containing protein [Vicinamibacterales bacterium]